MQAQAMEEMSDGKEPTMSDRFLYDGKVVTHDELRDIVEPEAARETPGTWVGGDFDFNDWVIDAVMSGLLDRVEDDL